MRILAFAHGCHPDRGSEDGAGWMWSRVLARLGEVTVITRTDNRQAIERALPTVPERENLRFVYLPPPRLAPRWRPDRRGKRLFYLLWQAKAFRTARRLCAEEDFDLAWHVTWSNVWVGSVGAFLGIPFVFGPLGGGVAPPWHLVPSLGLRGAAYELARAGVRTAGRYASPLTRASWRRASLLLVSTDEMLRWLPAGQRQKARIVPQAIIDPSASEGPLGGGERGGPDQPPTALFGGRLLAFKGGSLALLALRDAPAWRLVVCGDGPDGPRLRRLAARLGVSDRVEFMGQVPRDEVQRLMGAKVDVLLFPSMHDESPATVVEAAQCGLPVICLAHGGGPLLAGPRAHAVDVAGSPERVAGRLAAALAEVGRERGRPRTVDRDHVRSLSIDARVAVLLPEIERLRRRTTTTMGRG